MNVMIVEVNYLTVIVGNIATNVSRLGEVGDFENKIYYGNE
jgi:hypothetical protein